MEKPLKIRRQKQALYTLHEAHISVLLAAQKLVPSATHGRDNVKWDMKCLSHNEMSIITVTEWETFKRRLPASNAKYRLKLYWTGATF